MADPRQDDESGAATEVPTTGMPEPEDVANDDDGSELKDDDDEEIGAGDPLNNRD